MSFSSPVVSDPDVGKKTKNKKNSNCFHDQSIIVSVHYFVVHLVRMQKFQIKANGAVLFSFEFRGATKWGPWLIPFSIVTRAKSWHIVGREKENSGIIFALSLASQCVLRPVRTVWYIVSVLEEGESCSTIICQALLWAWSDQSVLSLSICFM